MSTERKIDPRWTQPKKKEMIEREEERAPTKDTAKKERDREKGEKIPPHSSNEILLYRGELNNSEKN